MFSFRIFALIIFLYGCENQLNIRLENVTQLSFQGDNGEAYFNADNSKVIFQSKRNGNECDKLYIICLLYTSPSPRDMSASRMPSSA